MGSKLGSLQAAQERAELNKLIADAIMVLARREEIVIGVEELGRLKAGDNLAVAIDDEGMRITFVPAGAPEIPEAG